MEAPGLQRTARPNQRFAGSRTAIAVGPPGRRPIPGRPGHGRRRHARHAETSRTDSRHRQDHSAHRHGPAGARSTVAAASHPCRGVALAGREHLAACARAAGGRSNRAAELRRDRRRPPIDAANRPVDAVSIVRSRCDGRGSLSRCQAKVEVLAGLVIQLDGERATARTAANCTSATIRAL